MSSAKWKVLCIAGKTLKQVQGDNIYVVRPEIRKFRVTNGVFSMTKWLIGQGLNKAGKAGKGIRGRKKE